MGTVDYLLDTHTLLWAIREPKKLSDTVKKILGGADTTFFVSAVSAYEIMYKRKLGKLFGFEDIADNYLEVIREFGSTELPISTSHAHLAGKIEWEHRDPFDRLLAAQSSVEGITLITNDLAFQTLPWISVLW